MAKTNEPQDAPIVEKEAKNADEVTKKEIPAAEKRASGITPFWENNGIGENKGDANGSFFDIIYDRIVDVIGGDDPQQYLCITLPGQALSPEDFAYDYKNNAPKGPTIEANESRLANKLFDPGHVVGADNGMTLPYQYRSALDTRQPHFIITKEVCIL